MTVVLLILACWLGINLLLVCAAVWLNHVRERQERQRPQLRVLTGGRQRAWHERRR